MMACGHATRWTKIRGSLSDCTYQVIVVAAKGLNEEYTKEKGASVWATPIPDQRLHGHGPDTSASARVDTPFLPKYRPVRNRCPVAATTMLERYE